MAARSLIRRLEDLEAAAGDGDEPYAVQLGEGDDAIVTFDDEQMAPDAFRRRYPLAYGIDIGGEVTHEA